MGVVRGSSISKQIQERLDNFEDKAFDLCYTEKIKIHAPCDYKSDNIEHVLFYLKGILDIEQRFTNGETFAKNVEFENIFYKCDQCHAKEEDCINVDLGHHRETFEKNDIEILVSFKKLGE
ncbi:MAG: hypothetical protein H6850_02030 [Alphaproteobacteria bacterium]|nr:MAG: hypothetical protein H6850_02030 [Alphaproteobacteria bacterium]